MLKIKSFTSRDFFRGIGPPYDTINGLFSVAEGIDLMRYPGLLAAGYVATDKDSEGAVVTDHILWFMPNPETDKCYAYGDMGRVYEIDMSTNAITFLGTVANSSGDGAIIYKDYLIYAGNTFVGNAGPLVSGITWGSDNDDDGISGAGELTSGPPHPMTVGTDGRCYVADDNELNSFSLIDDPPSSDWQTADFVLPSDHTIVSLENDGRYLIVGAVTGPTTYGPQINGIKIFYWDYLDANTWIKEYSIPGPKNLLYSLKKHGDWIYAFTRRGIYRFNFYYSPKLVVMGGIGITNLDCGAKQGAIDEWKGHLLWGADNGWAYGPSYPGRASFLSNPLRIGTGGSSTVYGLKVVNINKVYVGGGDPSHHKFYVFNTTNSAATATTALIDLGRKWEIVGLKIVMQTDGTVVGSITNAGGTAIVSGTLTTSGFIGTEGTASKKVDQIIINLTINSAARIKKVEVFANRVPDYI